MGTLEPDEPRAIIHTSAEGWLKQVAEYYREKREFTLIDDANVGVDPRKDSVVTMGRKASLTRHEWTGVLVSVGIAGVGAWLVVMAVLDPEPYSKVMSAILAGAALVGGGGLTAVRILTQVKPPDISVDRSGTFHIRWS
jgi:hypothetical protein